MEATGPGLCFLYCASPFAVRAQTDCLSCHADKTLQDASGHPVGVDGDKFRSSIHGSLGCTDCHTSIKEYPHPDQPAPVQCDGSCHADQAKAIEGSIHDGDQRSSLARAATVTPHSIYPKDDPRSRRCIR